MPLEFEDTTDPAHLIPMQGYPGHQEHQTCECGGEFEVAEVIWESYKEKRVKLACRACGFIQLTDKTNRMFRHRIIIRR